MSQELQDFEYFKNHQLHFFDRETGRLDVKAKNRQVYLDVGSKNEDGYVRVKVNGNLRMKHRLVYFLVTGKLPDAGHEIDHKNDIRDDNRPDNLHEVPKTVNNSGCANRKFGKQFTQEMVLKVCKLLAETELSDLAIAKKVGISRASVRDIKTRRTRNFESKGYEWPHRMKESSTTIETTS